MPEPSDAVLEIVSVVKLLGWKEKQQYEGDFLLFGSYEKGGRLQINLDGTMELYDFPLPDAETFTRLIPILYGGLYDLTD